METNNQLNHYSLKSVIALNDHLKSLATLETIFEYLASYFAKDFNLQYFKVSVNQNKLFDNSLKKDSYHTKEINISLNKEENLHVCICYDVNEDKNIGNSLSHIKTTFYVISQTIYIQYLKLKIDELSMKDHLTGVYNRQYIDEYLGQILPLAKRENTKIAFLKVGIDHFKAVIDEFDYLIGDKVLQDLAKCLEESVRESDIVAHIESDEFLIVLHNIINENNAIMVADKIINNFKNVQVTVNEETQQILMKTICTGISIYPDDAIEPEEIFRSSDIALYEARNMGRSQFFKFNKEAETIELF